MAGAPAQFSLGKSFPGFSPVGPRVVTLDEFDNYSDLGIECAVNGVVKQSSRTSLMIFDVPYIIRRLSSIVTLFPGDIIFTGTPGGNAVGQRPMVFLEAGDVVTTTIEVIGVLEHPASASDQRRSHHQGHPARAGAPEGAAMGIRAKDIAFVRFQAPDLDKMEAFLVAFGMVHAGATEDTLYMRGADDDGFIHVTHLADEPRFAGFALLANTVEDFEVLAALDGFSDVGDLAGPGAADASYRPSTRWDCRSRSWPGVARWERCRSNPRHAMTPRYVRDCPRSFVCRQGRLTSSDSVTSS